MEALGWYWNLALILGGQPSTMPAAFGSAPASSPWPAHRRGTASAAPAFWWYHSGCRCLLLIRPFRVSLAPRFTGTVVVGFLIFRIYGPGDWWHYNKIQQFLHTKALDGSWNTVVLSTQSWLKQICSDQQFQQFTTQWSACSLNNLYYCRTDIMDWCIGLFTYGRHRMIFYTY